MAPRNEDLDMGEPSGSPPDAPVSLEVTDWDASLVRLKWISPVNDGGLPITFFILEYKGKSDEDWQEATKVKPSKNPTGTVEGLTTGVKYEFRVKAENKSGKSNPSDVTLPMVVKAKKAAPKICRKTMEEKTIKVNQQLDLCVTVEGEPAPQCKWLLNGTEISSKDNVKVSYAANVAKLLLIPARRQNEGKYTLQAKNQHGEDSVEVEVKIFGKPTICQGPLNVSDVTKKSCRLEWKAPVDNGGSQIDLYEVEKLDETTGTWLPAGNPKGTSWELKNLVEGRNYKFLVRAVNKDGDSPNLESEEFITAKNQFDVPTRPGKPKVSNWGPDWAEITFKAPDDDGGAEIKEYKIEMRDVDKRAWNVIKRDKETTFTATNCGIEVGHEYVFRVTAYNSGGESETSESSTAIEAMERFIKPKLEKELLGKEKDLCATQMLRLEAVAEGEPAVKFNWLLPNGEELLHDGSRILIDNDTKNKSSLMFKNIERAHSGCLKCIAKNSQGEDEHEIRLNIVSPPSRPTGPIEITKVTPSGCQLFWQKPKDDGGSPITGYAIEKKDVEKDYWSPCGKVTGKMTNVMKEIEYQVADLVENFVYVFRVMAVNALGESDSLMTPMPMIAKHELDPPNQPFNINILDFDSKWVKLDWTIASGPRAQKFVVEKVETFMIPKDDEEEEYVINEDGEEEPVQKPGIPTVHEPGLKKGQEYVEYNTGWIVAGTTEDDMPEIKVSDIQEGYKYQFRVKAVNKAGPSYPSEPTDEIVAKVRKQKPVIDSSGMPKEITLSRGDNLNLKVKVKGEPVTDKAWFWGKREIKSSGTVVLDNTEYMSKISILHLERADTGTFTFKAENDHGSAECSINVNVMIPPQKPKGPMRVEDIYAEGCTVVWQPPEDDGGSPILYYLLERVQGQGENWIQCGRSVAPQTECKVTGLTQDKQYRVQVKAVNALGESEPLVYVDTFLTENPFSVPGAPGKPELKDWDSDHFDMKWTTPRNDGGSRITGYELEARLWKEPAWFRAGEVKMQLEHGLVEGIELGAGYAVRVRAKNAGGLSPWSMESDKVICKHKALKPKIKLLGPKDVTVKEGETVTLIAEIEGEPAPEPDQIKWLVGDSQLVTDESNGIIIECTKENKSKLQFDAVARKDCGIVTCEASNFHGSAKMSVNLIVIGKPSAPEDRLVVRKISSSGCKLKWESAKNSGGLPIEYLVEKFAVASDVWVKQGITSNTELLVNDLETGKEYDFRVVTINEVGESEALQTSRAIIAKNQYTVSMPPSQPDVTDWNERAMTIRWNEPIDDGGMPITGYTVEARTTGGQWQIWETLDTPETIATMHKLQKGQEYQFRVIATNKAGKSEPSHPSRPKLAKETDLIPFIDAKSLRDVTAEAKDRVKFDVPIFGEPAPEVTWLKGDIPVEELGDRSIMILNSETHSKIVFNNIAKCHEGNYQIIISNKSGDDSAKMSINVLDKPAAPEAPMKTTVEGNSVVLLWKKVKDDGGCPIEHYQVEKTDTEKESWAACGHTKENTITIPGLLSGITYKFRVCAMNRIGDSESLSSDSVSLADGDHPSVRSL